MAQIVPRISAWETLGQGLGTGLSQGLQQLAQEKMTRLQQRNISQVIQKGLGLNQEEGALFAQFPNLLQPYLERRGEQPSAQPMIPGQQLTQGQPVIQQPQQAQPGMQQFMQSQPNQLGGQQSQQPAPTAADILSRPKPLSPLDQEKLKMKEQANKESRDLRISAHNQPFFTKLNTLTEISEKMLDLADSMYEDVKSGEVATGWEGTIKNAIGTSALNDASQRFRVKGDNLAELTVRGVPTGFKLKFAQLKKPNLAQSRAVQESELRNVIKEGVKGDLYNRITNKIVTDNGGFQPLNLNSEVQKQYSSIRKKMKDLPNAIELPDGTVAYDKDSGLKFVAKYGVWRPDF